MRRLLFLCAALLAPLGAQTVIRETKLQAPGGVPITNGKIVLTPTAPFVAADGVRVEMQPQAFNIVNGAVTIPLEPNDTASPAGTAYKAVYIFNVSNRRTEIWVVPTSSTPLPIASVAQPVQVGQLNAAGLPDGTYCVTVVSHQVSLVPCTGGGSSSIKLSTFTNAQLAALTNGQLAALSN